MSKKGNTSLRDTVCRNLKAFRLEAGLSQTELAERCGFKKQYVSRLEAEPQNISLDILEKLAVGLKRNASEFISGERIPGADGIATRIAEAIRQLEIVQAKIGSQKSR